MVVDNWRKKLTGAIAAMLVLLIAAVGFFGYQMTKPIQPDWQGKPGEADLKSAREKLKLLGTAQQKEARGYIRLNEVEINSLIMDYFFTPKTNPPPSNNPFAIPVVTKTNPVVVLPKGLLRAAVTLSETNFALYYWEKKEIAGYEVSFAWKRVMTPQRSGKTWDFKLSEMQIGNVQIPEALWETVNKQLNDADTMFDDARKWINGLPWVEIGLTGTNKFGEAKLYTYVPTNAPSLTQ